MDMKINANICEVGKGGRFHTACLEWLPRAGELVWLTTFAEGDAGATASAYYEVVQVRHDIQEAPDKAHASRRGHHYLTVFVKPSKDELFEA